MINILKPYIYILLCAGMAFITANAAADEFQSSEVPLEILKILDFEEDDDDYTQARNRIFQEQGPLDDIFKDRVIVGDSTIYLDKECKIKGAKKGDYVGVKLSQSKKALLIQKIQAP